MQAQIFDGIMAQVWEHGPEIALRDPAGELIYTGTTWDVAHVMGASRKTFPQAGIDVFLFPDGSGALCGTRGASVIATWDKQDHEKV